MKATKPRNERRFSGIGDVGSAKDGKRVRLSNFGGGGVGMYARMDDRQVFGAIPATNARVRDVAGINLSPELPKPREDHAPGGVTGIFPPGASTGG